MTATENRLRESLSAAAGTVAGVRPLALPVRRRFRIPMLLVAAAVTMAAVGVGFVWAGQLDPRTTTAVQAAPTPEPQMEISIYLCKKIDPFPQCKGEKANKAKIAEALWSRPDVEWLRFESQAEAYKNYREQHAKNSVMLSAIQVKDMPESFRILPKQGADWGAIIATAKALPGVANVIDQRCVAQRKEC
jgi:cell division protein FtsX